MIRTGEPVNFYYSGPFSTRFWERINVLKNDNDMYRLGVMLQNLEEYVAEQLLKAEGKEKE